MASDHHGVPVFQAGQPPSPLHPSPPFTVLRSAVGLCWPSCRHRGLMKSICPCTTSPARDAWHRSTRETPQRSARLAASHLCHVYNRLAHPCTGHWGSVILRPCQSTPLLQSDFSQVGCPAPSPGGRKHCLPRPSTELSPVEIHLADWPGKGWSGGPMLLPVFPY